MGLLFRNAHHVTGQIVAYAVAEKLTLRAVPLAEMQKHEPRITTDVYAAISNDASLIARQNFGGTAPSQVIEACKRARLRFVDAA